MYAHPFDKSFAFIFLDEFIVSEKFQRAFAACKNAFPQALTNFCSCFYG
jgi:hypothetical protein